MGCRRSEVTRAAFVDGELSAFGARRFARHLARCPACAAEVAWLQANRAALAAVNPVPGVVHQHAPPRPAPAPQLALAAALSVFAFVAAPLHRAEMPSPGPPTRPVAVASPAPPSRLAMCTTRSLSSFPRLRTRPRVLRKHRPVARVAALPPPESVASVVSAPAREIEPFLSEPAPTTQVAWEPSAPDLPLPAAPPPSRTLVSVVFAQPIVGANAWRLVPGVVEVIE